MSNAVKLLLVEDNDNTRHAMKAYFEDVVEFEVSDFEDGSEVLEFLTDIDVNNYTALLLDYILQGKDIDGDYVLRTVREKYSSLPVIVFTGENITKGVNTLTQGAHDIFQRPIHYEQITASILQLEQKRQMKLVFTEIAKDIQDLLDVNLCMVWQPYDNDFGWRLRGQYTKTDFVFSPLEEQSPQFLEYVKAKLDESAQKDELYEAIPEEFEADVKSITPQQNSGYFIGFRLLADEQLAAVLILTNDTHVHFTDEQRKWINKYCKLAASVLLKYEDNLQLQNSHSNYEILSTVLDEKSAVDFLLENSWKTLKLDTIAFYCNKSTHLELFGDWSKKKFDILPNDIPNIWQDNYDLEFKRNQHQIDNTGQTLTLLPVVQSKRVLGAIAVSSPLRKKHDTSLLNLSYQIANVIGRASIVNTLQEISRYAQQGNQKALSKIIVEKACQLTDAYAAILWEPKKIRNGRFWELSIEALELTSPEYKLENSGSLQIRGEENIYAHAYLNAYYRKKFEPIVLNNAISKATHDAEIPQIKMNYWQSVMIVPLLTNDNLPLGLLSLHSPQPDRFHEYEKSVIHLMAAQASIGLEENLQRKRMKKLSEISNDLFEESSGRLLPKSYLSKIAKYACDLLNADCAVLFPYDERDHQYYQSDYVGTYQLLHGDEQVIQPQERGLGDYILNLNEPLYIKNVDKYVKDKNSNLDLVDRIKKSKLIKREKIKSFVGIPLEIGSNKDGSSSSVRVGLLYIDFRSEYRFTANERQVIEIFSSYIATALRGGMLSRFEREEQALRDFLKNDTFANVDKKKIAGKFLEFVVSITDCTTASVQWINEQDDFRYLLDGNGFDTDDADLESIKRPSKDGLLQSIFKSENDGILLADTTSESAKTVNWKKEEFAKDVGSWMGLLLRHPNPQESKSDKSKIIGLVTVDHTDKNFFNEHTFRFLKQYTPLVASALVNAEQNLVAEKRQRDLKGLSNAVGKIGETLDRKKLLQLLVNTLHKLLVCSHCTLYQVDSINEQFIPHPDIDAAVSSPHRKSKRIFSMSEPSILRKSYKFNHAIVLKNSWNDPDFAVGQSNTNESPRSTLVVPLKIRGEIIALVSADQDEYDWFSEQDKLFSETLCETISVALMRVRTLELLLTLNERALRITDVRDQPQSGLLGEIINTAVDMMQKDFGVIYLFKWKANNSIPEIIETRHTENFLVDAPRLNDERSLTRRILKERSVIAIDNTAESEDVNKTLVKKGILSLIGTPLIIDDTIVGILYLHHRSPYKYTEAEKTTLQILGTQAALMLQNTNNLTEAFLGLKEAVAFDHNTIDDKETENKIYHSVVQWLQALFPDVDLIEIKRVDNNKKILRVVGSYPPVADRKDSTDMSIEDGITGLAAKEVRSILVPDTREQTLYVRGDGIFLSELAVPIVMEEKGKKVVLGVINLEHKASFAFTKLHQNLAEAVAALTTVFITNLETLRNNHSQLVESTRLGSLGNEVAHTIINLSGSLPIRIEDISKHLLNKDFDGAMDELNKLKRPINRLIGNANYIRRFNQKEKEAINVKEFIEYAINDARDMLSTNDQIKFSTEISPGALDIYALPYDIESIFNNMLTNAIRSIRRGSQDGYIQIRAYPLQFNDESIVRIEFTDNGVGIDPNRQQQIFELGHTTGTDGLGFGLWRDKLFIETIGGKLELTSTSEETTFIIDFPAVPQDVEHHSRSEYLPRRDSEVQKPDKHIHSSNAVNILVLDDNIEIRDILLEKLATEAYNVFVYPDLVSARKKLDESPRQIDIVIVDIRLQDKDPNNKQGFDFIRNLDEFAPNTRKIIYTAFNTANLASEAYWELHVDSFIVKTENSLEILKDKVAVLVEEIRRERGLTMLKTGIAIYVENPHLQKQIFEMVETDGYVVHAIQNDNEFYQIIENTERLGLVIIDTNNLETFNKLSSFSDISKCRYIVVSDGDQRLSIEPKVLNRTINIGVVDEFLALDKVEDIYNLRILREAIRLAMGHHTQKYVSLTWRYNQDFTGEDSQELIFKLSMTNNIPTSLQNQVIERIRLPVQYLVDQYFTIRLSIYSDNLTSEVGTDATWMIENYSNKNIENSFEFRAWLNTGSYSVAQLNIRLNMGAVWLGTIETSIEQ